MYMKNIKLRLKELLENDKIKCLQQFLGLKEDRIIYLWKSGEFLPNTEHFIKLSKFFNCSLDFLFCRTDDFGYGISVLIDFDERLKEIMQEKGITQYKMVVKDKICSSNNFFKWFKLKADPMPETLIKLADYFGVSVDYLLGG